MRLVLEVPDSEVPYWIQRLKALGLSLVEPAPTATPTGEEAENDEDESPTIPRAAAESLRRALAEVREAERGGQPLLTEEEFWASLDEDDAV